MENNENAPLEIDVDVLKQQVDAGMKKDALAKHYGLPMTQMTKALQQAGLKIRKFHNAKFVLVSGKDKAEDNAQPVATEEVAKEEPVVAEEAVEEVTEDVINEVKEWK